MLQAAGMCADLRAGVDQKHRYIVVEGPIGVGKTTLARALTKRFGARSVFEIVEENPFLASFYQDRNKFAFQTQLFFLLSRFTTTCSSCPARAASGGTASIAVSTLMAAGIRGPSSARLCRTTRCRSTCSSARCDADVRFCRSLMINCARRAPSAMSSVIRERSSMTKRRSLRGESCKSARNSSSGSRFFPSASAAAAREGPDVALSVGDDGVGMTEEVRRQACEPFFTTRAAGEGSGLGLAIVASIVRGHKGTIEIHSAPGQGTQITVRVPAGRDVEELVA